MTTRGQSRRSSPYWSTDSCRCTDSRRSARAARRRRRWRQASRYSTSRFRSCSSRRAGLRGAGGGGGGGVPPRVVVGGVFPRGGGGGGGSGVGVGRFAGGPRLPGPVGGRPVLRGGGGAPPAAAPPAGRADEVQPR